MVLMTVMLLMAVQLVSQHLLLPATTHHQDRYHEGRQAGFVQLTSLIKIQLKTGITLIHSHISKCAPPI